MEYYGCGQNVIVAKVEVQLPCKMSSSAMSTASTSPFPVSPDVSEPRCTSLLALPNDVLYQILSYLSLRSVLRLEYLCLRLQQAITGYLSTIKRISLYHSLVKKDVFRHNVGTIPAKSLAKVLSLCQFARSIEYLGAKQTSSTYRELLAVIREHKNITTLELVDSKTLFDEVRAHCAYLTLCEVRLSSSVANLVSSQDCLQPSSYTTTTVVYVEDVEVDYHFLAYFSNCVDMSFIRCSFQIQPPSQLEKSISFPNLCSFKLIDQPGTSANSQVCNLLLRKISECDKLTFLYLGLRSDFWGLEAALPDWKATNLSHLQVISTGSYSAALQELKYASVFAEICHLCRGNLEVISLPSTILVKRFFTRLISSNSVFKQLQALKMTGIADTKMFLTPGNLVETVFYQEFLKLCPVISSLSLHSYTGSLVSLMLPLTLTELVLPWDNRLNLVKQCSEISSCLSTLPQLSSVSILGVEEVDTLLHDSFVSDVSHRRLPTLDINMETLRVFRLKNACVLTVDLTGCANLTSFKIQCCPTLQELNLPHDSLQEVCIYDQYCSYIDKFVRDFIKYDQSRQPSQYHCHIHIQLHSVVMQEPDAKKEHKSLADDLLSVVETACFDASSALEFIVLKDDNFHLSEHNSGESMYPFTEFQSYGEFKSGRSQDEVRAEICRMQCVLEGMRRWKHQITKLKKLSLPSSVLSTSSPNVAHFVTSYCDTTFRCTTNLDYLKRLNNMRCFCQSSSTCSNLSVHCNTVTLQPANAGSESIVGDHHDIIPLLNVPQLGSEIVFEQMFLDCLEVTHKPLVLVSIVEYGHNIYTLFYYD